MAICWAGCSDDPKKIYNDGGVALDSYTPNEGGSPDQLVPDQTVTPDLPPASSSAAQTVINKLLLPKSAARQRSTHPRKTRLVLSFCRLAKTAPRPRRGGLMGAP